jgi:iron complex transport system ATP-binding protein
MYVIQQWGKNLSISGQENLHEVLIDVRELSCCLEGSLILDKISFKLYKGDNLLVIGPNGAGKTTLLRCLLGLIPICGGEIFLNGKSIRQITPKQRARLLAYLPQKLSSSGGFNVEEFVKMSRYSHKSIFRTADNMDIQALENAIKLSACAPFLKRNLDTLSGGETQQVLLAAALAQEAGVILLDEPGSSLDPRQRVILLERLEIARKESSLSFLHVTHNIQETMLPGTKILALKNGQVFFTMNSADLSASNRLADLYGINFSEMKHPITGNRLFVSGGKIDE